MDQDGDGAMLAHRYGPQLGEWAHADGSPSDHGTARQSGAVVLAGPATGPDMAAVAGQAAHRLMHLSSTGTTVIIDCGRIGGPAAGLFGVADRKLLLVRDLPDHIASVEALLADTPGVAEVLRIGTDCPIPFDPQTAELAVTDDLPPHMLAASPLGRAIAAILTETGVALPSPAPPAWATATAPQGATA